MNQRTLTIPAIGAGAALVACTAMWLVSVNPTTLEASAVLLRSQPTPVPAEHLRLSLHRSGLDALSLTAAGVTSAVEINAVIAGVENELVGSPAAVTAAEQAVGEARQVTADTEHRIQSGTGSPEDVATLAGARATLTSATSARDTLIGGLFSAGVFSLAEETRTRLSTTQANQAAWELPVEYLVVARTEADWIVLRDALAHERITLARGETPNPDVQALLSAVRSHPAVVAAMSSLAAHQAMVQELWTMATAN